ncbi:crossover junction endodeoxyribonuclease RuvC [Sporocytophaga myxococcoides]|uniref:crossover junction endodeoxyribonuclease RuvC n=1 Tax=Sporocytophaga myxococcoides TaxID=153721 RepID=UPI00041AA791|nr:crossover junction endodeoxyribonuclease RuvC [Sporocytophaga myxococcoides]
MISKGKEIEKDKIILGVDPGTTIMGYGLIHIRKSKIDLLQFGVIHLSKYSNHGIKLSKIFERVVQLIDEYHPDEMAIESPFYGKNVQSMLKLGRAQGVAIAAAISREVPISEYAPKKVKQSVTGNGNASKEQVSSMLCTLLKIQEAPKLFDATDALAVALCHHFQGGPLKVTSGNWSSFLKDNPDRIVSGKKNNRE